MPPEFLRSRPRAHSFSQQRLTGAFYTPSTAADYMAAWAVRTGRERVLEPSMGDGNFIVAVNQRVSQNHDPHLQAWGVELEAAALELALAAELLPPGRAINRDFLTVRPFEVDVIIGNPPYVRLRHLQATARDAALSAAKAVLGQDMDPSGSVWMPFVLHATRFLAPSGRLALVLPFDFTYVRYARSLWSHLGAHFESLRLVRVFDRLFPELSQDVVLLLADGWGDRTDTVEFETYASASKLNLDSAETRTSVPIRSILSGEKPFAEAVLPRPLRRLLPRLVAETVEAREVVRWNIGYVCGDKGYFHPDAAVAEHYRLPGTSLMPTIATARRFRGAGILTSALPECGAEHLFLPGDSLTSGEQRYIALGERQGVAERYKCRVRDPWYVTPGVRVPDVLLPVFSERPGLALNDAGLVASNSMLCGYLLSGTGAELVSAWYTSLTLLWLELEVHSLGGGVMVLVPNEAGRVRVPRVRSAPPGHVAAIHELSRQGLAEEAFRVGDRSVLESAMGLDRTEIELVREGVAQLRRWRTSMRGEGPSAEVRLSA
ncbi:MAG: N-6 DNA methylase [Thermoleophilia bacterium]